MNKSGKVDWKRFTSIMTSSISDIFPKFKKIKFKSFFTKKPKIYKLRGFTTTSRVDKKVSREQTHRFIRNFLVAAVFILIISILLLIFNPLKDIKELFRMIGL